MTPPLPRTFNCVHSFSIEAADLRDCDAKLRRLHELINKASSRLDLGFAPGIMVGNAAARVHPTREVEEETPMEALFDV